MDNLADIMVTVLLTVVETVLAQLQHLQLLQHQLLQHQLLQHQLLQHQLLQHQLLKHQEVVLLMRYVVKLTIAMDKADVVVSKAATD
jgi:hypothetical protein